MIVEGKRAKRITGGMAANGEVLLNIPAGMAVDLQNATSEVPFLLGNAASIFGMLYRRRLPASRPWQANFARSMRSASAV